MLRANNLVEIVICVLILLGRKLGAYLLLIKVMAKLVLGDLLFIVMGIPLRGIGLE